MPERPERETLEAPVPEELGAIRGRNRSPHPYHHLSFQLQYPAERFGPHNETRDALGDEASLLNEHALLIVSKDHSTGSTSGTEADDEHFLKGLPAPKVKLHKGLRGHNEYTSGLSTPLASPPPLDEIDHARLLEKLPDAQVGPFKRPVVEAARRNRVLIRRATEVCVVASLGYMVCSNSRVAPLFDTWRQDFKALSLLVASLLVIYPVRVALWAHRHRKPAHAFAFRVPSNFDPAPLLYPPTITIFTTLLVSVSDPTAILPSVILSICSIPQALIPKIDHFALFDTLHWVLASLPLVWCRSETKLLANNAVGTGLSAETLILLYPLHQTLCVVLRLLTTTSLLEAELQLLSIALISVLILASSPQIQILKALLWVGGLSTIVICGPVIKWGITLARVPKWRFRRALDSPKRLAWATLLRTFSWRNPKYSMLTQSAQESCNDSTSADEGDAPSVPRGPIRTRTIGPAMRQPEDDICPTGSKGNGDIDTSGVARRRTISHVDKAQSRPRTHTPSGRRKRTTSNSIRPFLKLTLIQATIRTWLYALYVYVSLAAIILIGVRAYVQQFALDGNEPIGWALGYLLGDRHWFRFQVVQANLERCICLPRLTDLPDQSMAHKCHMGWVEHIRHNDFGEANSRLILSGYWVLILIIGLTVVFRLKETYEVDTRRKVFHFMMVGMFLPGTFIDPTFAALALALVLAIFLILDLLRASQLPPLSKPIASFLAPYVDGRDFRGPVVISHIFLLIGCAIPLWLALATLSRTGTEFLAGWEVPTRDVSMVSGVICVGLGDAAASLIGRRYGHRKWLWGGGESLEGSVAFAAAVFTGLAVAKAWLRVGGWPSTDEPMSALTSAQHAGVCASMASLTEAVLTGGNDNVIVPVVLWTCVKSLGI
ncbi:hypothetical protein HIM_07537 [Hirsutella minnesotensis 3608]|uniref:dolichol kinase n=1 Tax=Hirsutella minnesotensis 3608 TaxID=1043627 RepID=A0A0F7ZTI1_9HYPO|nr:hypothetical protein HIM_07537 [Hirsutella minnesotensis 3608]